MSDSKKFQKLKEEYYKIEIPSEIDSYVKNGIGQGKSQVKQNKRTSKWIKWVGSVAAIFVAFAISINTIPSFADTIFNIPGIGKLVQVLQFNEGSSHGGTITDGTDVEFISMQNNENIIINFTKDHIPKDFVNYFRVDYSEYPYTLTFSIPGARQFSAKRDLETLKQSTLIKDAYEITTLDDSMIRFSLTFNEPFSYEVREYENPAQVVVQLSPKKEVQKHTVYSIRSKSYSYGEELGILEEELFDLEDIRILKDEEGTFCVEVGYFKNIDEASKKMEELKKKYPILSQFYIEERNPLAFPKYITE